MLIFLIFLAFWALYSFLFNLIDLGSPYWIILWIVLGLICAAITLVILIILVIQIIKSGKNYKAKWKHEIIYQAVKFILMMVRVSTKVEGKENIPPKHPFVVYGNHKSMCDVMIVYKVYHTQMSAVAKNSLANLPILSSLMRSFKVAFINRENDREGVKALLEAIKVVEGGFSMMIFPEGGIKSREVETMVELKPGAYKLATKANATISPVSIVGSSKISKNAPFKRTKVKVIIHKPIQPSDYEGMDTIHLGEMVGKIIDEGVINEQKK